MSKRSKRCEACHRRRNLRGWRLCDECAQGWAYANGLDEWECMMRAYGWAVVPSNHDLTAESLRVVTVAEVPWDDVRTQLSTLWDDPPRRRLTPRERVAQRHREPAP